MSSQYTISIAHVQSVYHISCLHPVRITPQCSGLVRIPSLLPLASQIHVLLMPSQYITFMSMSSQYILYPVHVQSIYNLAYHVQSVDHVLPMFCQNTTFPSNYNQPEFYFFCPCLASTPSLLSMYSLYIITSFHV